MIKTTPLSVMLGVNAQTVCDCGCTTFQVGIAYIKKTDANFIRILECTQCHTQMAVSHQTDSSNLAPRLTGVTTGGAGS